MDHQAAEGTGKRGFGLANLRRSLGANGIRTELDDGLQRAALVAHIAFDRLDQVGNEIMPALELHVDLGPGVVHLVAQVNETVVDRHEPEGQKNQNPEENKQWRHNVHPFAGATARRA